jgi:hypothetical protein
MKRPQVNLGPTKLYRIGLIQNLSISLQERERFPLSAHPLDHPVKPDEKKGSGIPGGGCVNNSL